MKKIFLAASVAALSFAGSASALTLIGATVTGPTGTVWRTNGSSVGNSSNYTLFLASPTQASFINPNDQAVSQAVVPGSTRYFLSGDGYPTNTTLNSDSIYTLTLDFDGGQKLSGTYTPMTNSFLGSSSFTDAGRVISLAEFSYVRFLGDSVSQHVAAPGSDGNDYNGNFRFTSIAAAVPEPANWALMIGGFGLAGMAARRRNRTVAVTYA